METSITTKEISMETEKKKILFDFTVPFLGYLSKRIKDTSDILIHAGTHV